MKNVVENGNGDYDKIVTGDISKNEQVEDDVIRIAKIVRLADVARVFQLTTQKNLPNYVPDTVRENTHIFPLLRYYLSAFPCSSHPHIER
jgi:hypothetical protein